MHCERSFIFHLKKHLSVRVRKTMSVDSLRESLLTWGTVTASRFSGVFRWRMTTSANKLMQKKQQKKTHYKQRRLTWFNYIWKGTKYFNGADKLGPGCAWKWNESSAELHMNILLFQAYISQEVEGFMKSWCHSFSSAYLFISSALRPTFSTSPSPHFPRLLLQTTTAFFPTTCSAVSAGDAQSLQLARGLGELEHSVFVSVLNAAFSFESQKFNETSVADLYCWCA